MKIVPLAAESLGVRSVATYVECGATRLVIDPGASLAPSRFNLPPADAGGVGVRQPLPRGPLPLRSGALPGPRRVGQGSRADDHPEPGGAGAGAVEGAGRAVPAF